MEKPIAKDANGSPIRVGDVVSPGWPPDRFYRVVSVASRYSKRSRIYLHLRIIVIGAEGGRYPLYHQGDMTLKAARTLRLRRDDFIDEGL